MYDLNVNLAFDLSRYDELRLKNRKTKIFFIRYLLNCLELGYSI